jgi:tetratricopeptide (TPR) repeat protein
MRGRLMWAVVCAALAAGGVQSAPLVGRSSQESLDDLRQITRTLTRYRRDGDVAAVVDVARKLEEPKLSYMLLLPLLLGDADARGEGFLQLAYVEMSSGNNAIARAYAEEAAGSFLVAGDKVQQAYALARQSQADWKEGKLSSALELADRALQVLSELDAGAPRPDTYARSWSRALIARIDALRRLGDIDEVTKTFDLIRKSPHGKADEWLLLKEGMHLEELGHEGAALTILEGITSSDKMVRLQILSNLANLRRRNYAVAMDFARQAEEVNEGSAADLEIVRARIEAKHSHWDAAWHRVKLARTFPVSDGDWKWVLEHTAAQVLEARWSGRNLREAEHLYRRAIEEVEVLRQSSLSHCAYLVESHRAPYEGLISLLASQDRWREAVEVVLRLDSSDMLRVAAGCAQSVPAHEDLDAMLEGSAPHDVVILIARRERELGEEDWGDLAYRIRIHDRQISGEPIGKASDVLKLAKKVDGKPGDRARAQELGKMFVPPGDETSTLQVLTLGRLNEVPLNALRGNDGSLISLTRPLVRILALRTSTPATSEGGDALIVANSKGDLWDATLEGAIAVSRIAAMLPGKEIRVAGHGFPLEATSTQLLSKRQLAVLHRGGWRTLVLSDDVDVGPQELLRSGVAPRLALLAACGSLVAKDGGGWGSIVAALIEGGTWRVLATDQDVDSSVARRLMQEFYAQPEWYSDPERALGRAQAVLDAQGVPADQWAPFGMVGRPPFLVRAEKGPDNAGALTDQDGKCRK